MDVSPRTSRAGSKATKMASPRLGLVPSSEILSPAQRKGLPRSPSSTSSDDSDAPPDCGKPLNAISFAAKEKNITRPLARGAPGDGSLITTQATANVEQMDMGRRRSRYYETVFAHREAPGQASERVSKDSIIMAEIKTNVIVNNEYSFITGLSSFLSLRYQRPENCILISLQHSSCILFAGSFDPTYLLTITGLPQNTLPASNKRNAALVSAFLADNLDVDQSRGIIKFVAVPNSELAIGGKTLLAQQEEIDQAIGKETAQTKKMMNGRKGSRSQSVATGMTHGEKMPPMPPPPPPKSSAGRSESVSLKKRKSFLKMFGKSKVEA